MKQQAARGTVPGEKCVGMEPQSCPSNPRIQTHKFLITGATP